MDSPLTVASVYEAHVDFVWRSLRRLGIPPAQMDDAVQDVFVVVQRKLGEFEQRSSVKTWLFGIVLRVSRDHRRALQRKRAHGESREDPDALPDQATPGPHRNAEQADAIRQLEALVAEIGADKREVFLLAELEQMTAPEISVALGIPLTTTYFRLRAARSEFEQALRRQREGRGPHGAE